MGIIDMEIGEGHLPIGDHAEFDVFPFSVRDNSFKLQNIPTNRLKFMVFALHARTI